MDCHNNIWQQINGCTKKDCSAYVSLISFAIYQVKNGKINLL